jgi:hypothetical protein
LTAATLSLDPADGRVFGPPGTTVSWGFTITNDSGYVVPISLLYVDPVQIGTQTPIYFDFQVLTPDAPDNTLEGTFYFMIDPFAPAGANSLGGYLSLLYDRYSSADLGEQIGFSEEATADASVWVTPEPAVWKLIGRRFHRAHAAGGLEEPPLAENLPKFHVNRGHGVGISRL